MTVFIHKNLGNWLIYRSRNDENGAMMLDLALYLIALGAKHM